MVKFIQKHFISVSFCIILFFIIAIIIANFNIVYLIVKKSDKNISEQCSLEKGTIDENIENNMNELVEESENKKYSDSAKQDDTLSKINIYRTNKWRIKIPVLGLDAPISQGTSSEELRRTVGHFEETDKWDGNVALAAHNRGYKCNFFQEIRKLKDGDGNYLLNRNLDSKWGYELLGKPVYTTDRVNELGTATKPVIFYGDFSGLAVKHTEELEINILLERYATQHAIGVCGYTELDAKVENTQKIAVAYTGTTD